MKSNQKEIIELAKELFIKSAIVGADVETVQLQANNCLETAILFYKEIKLFTEME